jgi:hypothetical protein
MRFFACSDDLGYGMTRTKRREMAPGREKFESAITILQFRPGSSAIEISGHQNMPGTTARR